MLTPERYNGYGYETRETFHFRVKLFKCHQESTVMVRNPRSLSLSSSALFLFSAPFSPSVFESNAVRDLLRPPSLASVQPADTAYPPLSHRARSCFSRLCGLWCNPWENTGASHGSPGSTCSGNKCPRRHGR